MKYNCDGSFKARKASVGILCRNNLGNLIDCHGSLVKASTPLHNELFAIHGTCSLAYQRKSHSAFIESDSLTTILLASSNKAPPWHVSAIVDDIRVFAATLNLKFHFIPRLCNAPAHWIAKKTYSSVLPLNWTYCPPCELSSLLR